MKPSHQVTIKDIAQHLKISSSTVSRALRGSTEINNETRRRVQELAKEWNYIPDPVALSLKDKRTRVIGVIVQEIANNYCSATIAAIEELAYKKGYHVVIFQSHETYECEVTNAKLLASRRIDGLIITVSNETKKFDHLKELIANGIPVVMFDRVSEEVNTHKVVVDDYQGAFDATSHLIQQGYRDILHLTISPHVSIAQNRLRGYMDALKANDISINKEWIVYCGFDVQNIDKVVRRFLNKKKKRPNAILASVERLTIECLKILKDMQLRIPEDIALVGFSDNPLNRHLNPALTSIQQPTYEIGYHAAELLIELIESPQMPEEFRTVELKTILDIQESSMKKVN